MYILGRQSGESGKSRQRNGYRKVNTEKSAQRKRNRKVSVEKNVVAYRENI